MTENRFEGKLTLKGIVVYAINRRHLDVVVRIDNEMMDVYMRCFV